MWGALLKAVLEFFWGKAETFANTETKAVDAKTTDETKDRFQSIKDRIRPAPADAHDQRDDVR